MEKITLNVPAISCGHCVMAVTKALDKLEGVDDVDVNLGKKAVTVSFDSSKVSVAKIGETLAEEGYPVAR